MSVTIAGDDTPGWSSHQIGERAVCVAGYVTDADGRTLEGADAARLFATLPFVPQAAGRVLCGLDGHFAFAVSDGVSVLAGTDVVASYPLYVARTMAGDGMVGLSGAATRQSAGLNRINHAAAEAMALAGFTFGASTLYHGVQPLRPAEIVLVGASGIESHRWLVYRSWEVEERDAAVLADDLCDLMLRRFEILARGAADRPIVVPLSAGLDSRVLVSALKMVGAKDVRCFSYGLPGNHEARAAQAIAERLGYPWTFVPYSRSGQRALFASAEHDAYIRTADSLMAVPFEQDFPAIRHLLHSGWLPRDALLVNGQSGDFITGGHVPGTLARSLADMTAAERWDAVFAAVRTKHLDLWRTLSTPDVLARLQVQVRDHLRDEGIDEVPENAFGAYELSEYDNRQSKYVVGGQRVYDHFGLGWRLPLWDREFVAFWRTVPVEYKLKQRLYRETLLQRDWGGVWHGIPSRRTVQPAWIRPLRWIGKAACLPFGKKTWHRLDKRVFAPLMDLLQNNAAVPYSRLVADGRGYRNSISWLAEIHLARHGLDWRGQSLSMEKF